MSRLWDTEPELIPFALPAELETIKNGLFVVHEPMVEGLRRRLDKWRKQLPKPTREQMLQVTHEENRMHARLNGGNQQFWDGLEADWRRKQKPDFEPVRSDDSWPDEMRTWVEMERQEGRIYEDHDEAASAYMRTGKPPGPKVLPNQAHYEAPFESLSRFEQNHILSKRKQLKKDLHDLDLAAPKDSTDSREVLKGIQLKTDAEMAELLKPKTVRELVDESPIASEPHFTILEDSGPASSVSGLLNKIPVWKEFGAWLKWASACFAFAATMTQLGEYGWALLGLILCGLCCLTQIAVWTASPSIYKNALAKIFLAALSIALIIVAALTLVRIKGEKPWSVWQTSGVAPTPTPQVELRPGPLLPSPSSTLQTSPFPSPSPSLSSHQTVEVTPSPLSSLNVPLTPWNGIPFKAGITYRLADLMSADGYTGTTMMGELYVQASDTFDGTILIGPQPDLNAKNSTRLQGAGERMDYRGGADTRGIYIRADKNGKIDVMFKPR